tara:strand:+ start:36397 stop:36888 length:492 start_codon:yes stop_codon:yes gene_type:complete
MEKKANAKIMDYISGMQTNIISKIQEGMINEDIIKYIQDYELFTLVSEDFTKRKRVKNKIPLADRCCAKRADGDQCTRRKKTDNDAYCGTHMKGTPHGTINIIVSDMVGIKKEVWVEEIGGIMYYLDNNNNVYSTEDIMSNRDNPKIIAKWNKNMEGDFILCD